MKDYIGTKRLKAMPMSLGEYNVYRGWTLPENEDKSAPGYLVEYVGGGNPNHKDHENYISWSPTDTFESAYEDTMMMSFEHALTLAKAGHRVMRLPWAGQGRFIYGVPEASYPAQTGIAKEHFGENALVPYGSYIAQCAEDKVFVYNPSTEDMFAKDWILS